jgi:hypothetical protein
MGHPRATAVSIASGVLLGLAWLLYLDGHAWNSTWKGGAKTAHDVVLLVSHPRQPPFHWYYALPMLLITVSMFALNLTSAKRLSGAESLDDSDGRTTAVKAYVFVVVTCAMACAGGAVFIGIVKLGEPLPVTQAPTAAPGLLHLPPLQNPFKPAPTAAPPMTDEEAFTAWPGIAVTTSAVLAILAGVLFFGGRHPL